MHEWRSNNSMQRTALRAAPSGGVLPSAFCPALRAVHQADAADMFRRKQSFRRSMRLIRRPLGRYSQDVTVVVPQTRHQ
jgi:hypothetical protein